MTCVGSQFSDNFPATFCRGRRPALIPPNCSLSAAEKEELVRTRIQQPLFPPPDPQLFQNTEHASSTRSGSSDPDSPLPSTEEWETQPQSHSSIYKHRTNSGGMPAAITRDPWRRANYLKARAQQARDSERHRNDQNQGSPSPEPIPRRESSNELVKDPKTNPKANPKRLAFVIDQEMRALRADTPHLSELLPGEDVSTDDPGMEDPGLQDLGVGAEVAASPRRTSKRSNSHTITSMPDEAKIKKDQV